MNSQDISKILKEKGITPEKMLEIAKQKLAEAKKAGNSKLVKQWEKRIKQFSS